MTFLSCTILGNQYLHACSVLKINIAEFSFFSFVIIFFSPIPDLCTHKPTCSKQLSGWEGTSTTRQEPQQLQTQGRNIHANKFSDFVLSLSITFVLFSLLQLISSSLINLTNFAAHIVPSEDIEESRVSFPQFLAFLARSDNKLISSSSLSLWCRWQVGWMGTEHLHPSYTDQRAQHTRESSSGQPELSPHFPLLSEKPTCCINHALFRIRRFFFMHVWTMPNSIIKPWSPHKPLCASLI